jgi:hypothetical protein
MLLFDFSIVFLLKRDYRGTLTRRPLWIRRVSVPGQPMRKHAHRRTLIGFLILLMLSNSSLALEVLTHESHGHSDRSTTAMMTEQTQSGHHAQQSGHGHGDVHAGMANPTVDAESTPEQLAHGEDCICDDICCVSSVTFAVPDLVAPHPGDAMNKLHAFAFYQSISLDLLLPPPIANSLVSLSSFFFIACFRLKEPSRVLAIALHFVIRFAVVCNGQDRHV